MARLQPATLDDVRELVSWFQSLEEARTWGGPDFEFPCDLAAFARQCRLSELSSWVLRTGNDASPVLERRLIGDAALVGFGQFYLRRQRCHLARLAIAPGHRRQGHGKHLVRSLLATGSQQLQTTEASLFVYDDNTAAVRLYEQLGFRKQPWPSGEPHLTGISFFTRAAAHVTPVSRLRAAAVEDLESLSSLCLRSKAHWGYDDAFLEACRSELRFTHEDLTDTAVAVLEGVGGKLLGVAQVSTQGVQAWVEKLFVEPSCLRSGAGRRLYEWCLATARERGAAALIIESDPNAEAFYLKMGATPSGTAPSASVPGRVLPRLVHALI